MHIIHPENRSRYLRRGAVIVHDLVMTGIAWWLAVLIRLSIGETGYTVELSPGMVAAVIATQAVVLWLSGLYRGVWRFASLRDLLNITRAAIIGAMAVGLGLFLLNRLEGMPRAVLLFYPALLILLLAAPRLMYRMWKDYSLGLNQLSDRKRMLILGAGRAGEMLVRDMLHDKEYVPVAFLDDNRNLKGGKIHGIPVRGPINGLRKVVERYAIDLVIIAIPSADSVQMQTVVGLCEQAGVPFLTLPKVKDIVSGRATLQTLREVAIEDLLGRDPVSLDWEQLRYGISGKTVLIRGAGGSIGSEMCRQIAALKPRCLVLLERGEFNLYAIEMELGEQFPELDIAPCLADVCDPVAVNRLFSRFRPQLVFHAAAYKHVPLLQEQIREAVRNNVLGTRNLATAADAQGCETFVMISTDKAVNPSNVMGACKRVAERYCQSFHPRSATHFITVRFGNVLGSAGSVVPLFRRQIAEGGPVTVTHQDIERFFMTISEACQLVMQAGVMGKGGEIFVLDMGEPVSIRYLAEQMIRLSGKQPDQDIRITYIGLRPGEKLYEELSYEKENITPTDHSSILLAHTQEGSRAELEPLILELDDACRRYDEPLITKLMQQLVPTWSGPENQAKE
jgi:FlaA1/EpsC-like NDP-sugar epimerase